MQRNAQEKENDKNSLLIPPINSTTQIYQTLKNTANIDNNAFKIALLLTFLTPVEAQQDMGKEVGIALGCILTLCIALTLCALTKAKLLNCCETTKLSDSLHLDLEKGEDETHSSCALPSYKK